ncbi:MAG: hypothetical protein R6V28_03545 [Nitriliruptoraceae bacterium]
MLGHRRLGVIGAAVVATVLVGGCGDADPDGDVDDPPPTPDEQPGDDDGDGDEGEPTDGDDDGDDDGDGDEGEPTDGDGDDGDDGDGDDGDGDEGDGDEGDGDEGDGDEGEPTDGDGDGDDGDDDGGQADDGDSSLAPLDGDPTTEPREATGEPGTFAVTEVRLGQHDGFDRVVFELAGDGSAGWLVEYVDQARAQGSGATVEVDGDAVLRVAIRNVPLPPDLPDTIEVWDQDRVRAPSGGVVTEVVNDTIFEGQHTFFIGTTGEQPFLIERLEDPQRVVIDVFDG